MFNSDEKDQNEQLEPPSMAGNTSAWVAAVRGVTDGKFGVFFMKTNFFPLLRQEF